MRSFETTPVRLPNDEFSETALLYCLIHNKEAREHCATLDSSVFYHPANETIFKGIMDLHYRHEVIEWPLLVNHFTTSGTLGDLGGIEKLDTVWDYRMRSNDDRLIGLPQSDEIKLLTSSYPSYVAILSDLSARRQGISAAMDLQRDLFNRTTDINDILYSHRVKIRRAEDSLPLHQYPQFDTGTYEVPEHYFARMKEAVRNPDATGVKIS